MLFIGAFSLVSCQTKESKVESAEEAVDDAKQDLKEIQTEAKSEDLSSDYTKDWEVFKIASEAKIKDNETLIAALRVKLSKPGKALDPLYAKRIEVLEQKNRYMREIIL